ncbi:MAG: hypothetical protein PVH87_08385 [Desulfobacteraceae bacterium]
MPYSIEEHRHRFAAWAASRAANVINCRFKVEQGKKIIELSGLMEIGAHINNLPYPNNFDEKHREWRYSVIEHAQKYQPAFTHGVAAKLINIYLKSIYVCGGKHDDPRVMAIHPPIDSILLDSLCASNTGGLLDNWQFARQIGWSKLSSKQYEDLIGCIKKVIPEGVGLWFIEKHWQGFQSQNINIVKVDNSRLCKKTDRRPNADKLWDVVKDLWPVNSQWQTIDEIKELAPIGTAGIGNRSSYDFAMLTMLSTVRRNYIVHEQINAEKEINDEVVKTNRNNGIWRYHLNSRVRKAI